MKRGGEVEGGRACWLRTRRPSLPSSSSLRSSRLSAPLRLRTASAQPPLYSYSSLLLFLYPYSYALQTPAASAPLRFTPRLFTTRERKR